MKLTEEQEKNYLEKPETCPVCGSDKLDKYFDFSPKINEKLVECETCSSRWTEHYQLIAISNVRRREDDEEEDDEDGDDFFGEVLTVEKLKNMAPDECFARGITLNNPDGIYMSMQREGEQLMWKAVRGAGFHDWAIYINWGSDGWNYVTAKGEKVTTIANVKRLVEADDDALALYRL